MAIIKCKMCGGDLSFAEGATVAECEYCGSKQTLPALRNENVSALFNRANILRMKSEFDKAEEIYEKILQMDDGEAEAYWGLILCRYGVEYVEDPKTMERIPTCHRASYEAITADEDYKSALRCADALQREVYEAEAKRIDAIQKGILDISKKEKPYDVFICYKETDENGKRTIDSTIGNDIYYQLTQEGFKVFYAAITLEDKLGQEYEPYIFSALNSAKVMLVLGTKPEYFTAVWVKNEWSRFLKMMKSDRSKLLIPCYRDMDAYELPEDFAHLQAQDMSKIGFINDVVRGIKKVIVKDEPKPAVRETVVVQQGTGGTNAAALLKRGNMALEDGEWDKAGGFFEEVLNMDAECAEAYLGLLMAELRVKKQADLKNCAEPFDGSKNYQKTLRFAGKPLADELKADIAFIKERNETNRKNGIYNDAVSAMQAAKTEEQYKAAAEKFKSIRGWKDADTLAKQCLEKAEACRKAAEERRKENIYAEAASLAGKGNISSIEQAIAKFKSISGWRDADTQLKLCQEKIEAVKAKEEAKRLDEERQRKIREREEQLRKEKNKKIGIIIGAAAAVIIAAVIVITTVIIPGNKYKAATELMNAGKYDEAIDAFEAMNGYMDSAEQIENCNTALKDIDYDAAAALMNAGRYDEAIAAFEAMDGYRDSTEQIQNCNTALKDIDYDAAVALMDDGKYEEAIAAFDAMDGYRDSAEQIESCKTAIVDGKYNTALQCMDKKEYEKAYNILSDGTAYKDNGQKRLEAAHLRGDEYLLKGDCKNAVKWYELANDYDGAKGLRYSYVLDHKNITDLLTYEFLEYLKQEGYSDAAEIYASLYKVTVKIIFNEDRNDTNTSKSTINSHDSFGNHNAYCHLQISGGVPSGENKVRAVYETRWGYDNTPKEPFKVQRDGEITLKAGEDYIYHAVSLASNLYYHRVTLFDIDTDEQIAQATLSSFYY